MSSDTWRPTATNETLRKRAAMLASARTFFANRDVLEVESPIICGYSVTDPYIDSIGTDIGGQTCWLRSSPEYHMKRLLANGIGDIYQIAKVFRAGERGPRHEPEFTMIEWYRLGFELEEMIQETCELLFSISSEALRPITTYRQISYRDAFIDYCAIDPISASIDDLKTSASNHLPEVVTAELIDSLGTERNEWLDLLASHLVYPQLNGPNLWVVHSYPADQAMLARLNPENGAIAERFEVFFCGLELANGFRELTDASLQAQRFEHDRLSRKARNRPDVQPDKGLLAALTHGMPECSGVAIGLDRLIMVAEGHQDIKTTLSFAAGT